MRRDTEVQAFAVSWPLALLLSALLGCGRATDRTMLAVGGEPDVVAPGDAPPGSEATDPLPPPGAELPEGPLERQLDAIVERECRSCHDGSANDPAGSLSLGDLIDTGAVKVGSGETSPLILRLQYGDSRPSHRGVEVGDAELVELIRAINEREHDDSEACGPFSPVSRDEIYATVLRDISSRPVEERHFTRYVGLSYATNAGLCGSFLSQHINALSEMLNATSTRPEVARPRLVDELFTPIFAIDLRDYGYDRPVDLWDDGDVDFDDAWLAIVTEMGPYALALAGAEANELVRQTQTAVPFVSANALIQVASGGDIYDALVGVRRNLSDTAAALGVGVNADVAGVYRAGTFRSAQSPDRLVTRHAQAAHPGRAYWTLVEGEGAGAGLDPGLREDPLEFQGTGSEVIFNLPNGMLAFTLAGADGAPNHELPKCSSCRLPRALSPVTCRGCHINGLYSPRDEVLDFANANPERYDEETLTLIARQYRPAAELAGVVGADNALHSSAINELGIVQGHIGTVFYAFRSHPLTAVSAAAELGVSVPELRDALGRLQPAPGTPLDSGAVSLLRGLMLDGGRVERDVLTVGFQSLACAVPTGRNRPINCP